MSKKRRLQRAKLTRGVVNPPLAEAMTIGFWCDSILDQRIVYTVLCAFFIEQFPFPRMWLPYMQAVTVVALSCIIWNRPATVSSWLALGNAKQSWGACIGDHGDAKYPVGYAMDSVIALRKRCGV